MNFDSYIDERRQRFQQVEQDISTFDFQKRGQQEYEKINREYQYLGKLCKAWDELQKAEKSLEENRAMLATESDPEFQEIIKGDIAALEPKLPLMLRQVKTLILPPSPNDGRNVIVEIRPAAGGDEAGLFAADLLRMYTRFAELKRWKLEVLDQTGTELGGIKTVSLSIQGADAYTLMITESGVHRVQRVPTTETQGRVHTSTVTVAVLPEPQDVDLKIDEKDLRFDTFRASGAGGQCVNRTDSAVRITHVPTGIFVASQQERSQHRNREICMRLLRAKLLEIEQQKEEAKHAEARRSQIGTGDRSERIRTYNFPQNRITDHRFGITVYDLPNILEGNLGEFLAEVAACNAERRLAEEMGIPWEKRTASDD